MLSLIISSILKCSYVLPCMIVNVYVLYTFENMCTYYPPNKCIYVHCSVFVIMRVCICVSMCVSVCDYVCVQERRE